MKASHPALMLVKCIALFLELQMVLIWVPYMPPFMLPMMSNLWVGFLVIYIDKMVDVIWVHLVVLLMEYLRDQHLEYHLDILMVKHWDLIKSIYLAS